MNNRLGAGAPTSLSSESQWRLCWLYERCYKRENKVRREGLRKALEELGGSLTCLRKAAHVTSWLEQTAAQGSQSKNVIIMDWREAQPCLQAIASQSVEHYVQPDANIVLCKGKQLARAAEWSKRLPIEAGPVLAYEMHNIPRALLGGLVREHLTGAHGKETTTSSSSSGGGHAQSSLWLSEQSGEEASGTTFLPSPASSSCEEQENTAYEPMNCRMAGRASEEQENTTYEPMNRRIPPALANLMAMEEQVALPMKPPRRSPTSLQLDGTARHPAPLPTMPPAPQPRCGMLAPLQQLNVPGVVPFGRSKAHPAPLEYLDPSMPMSGPAAPQAPANWVPPAHFLGRSPAAALAASQPQQKQQQQYDYSRTPPGLALPEAQAPATPQEPLMPPIPSFAGMSAPVCLAAKEAPSGLAAPLPQGSSLPNSGVATPEAESPMTSLVAALAEALRQHLPGGPPQTTGLAKPEAGVPLKLLRQPGGQLVMASAGCA